MGDGRKEGMENRKDEKEVEVSHKEITHMRIKQRGRCTRYEWRGLTDLRGVNKRRREAKSQNREERGWGTKKPRAG